MEIPETPETSETPEEIDKIINGLISQTKTLIKTYIKTYYFDEEIIQITMNLLENEKTNLEEFINVMVTHLARRRNTIEEKMTILEKIRALNLKPIYTNCIYELLSFISLADLDNKKILKILTRVLNTLETYICTK